MYLCFAEMLTEQSLPECNQAGFKSISLVTRYGMPYGCVHYQLHSGLPLHTFARCFKFPTSPVFKGTYSEPGHSHPKRTYTSLLKDESSLGPYPDSEHPSPGP